MIGQVSVTWVSAMNGEIWRRSRGRRSNRGSSGGELVVSCSELLGAARNCSELLGERAPVLGRGEGGLTTRGKGRRLVNILD